MHDILNPKNLARVTCIENALEYFEHACCLAAAIELDIVHCIAAAGGTQLHFLANRTVSKNCRSSYACQRSFAAI